MLRALGLKAFLPAFLVLSSAVRVRAQELPADEAPTRSCPLSITFQHRVATARETALERKDVKAVRALLRFSATFREQPASTSGAKLDRELLKVEEHLGINRSKTPHDGPTSVTPVFVPHELHADISYAGEQSDLDPRRTLDIYEPAGANKAPVLIWIHGGGLTGGDKAHPGLTLIKPDFFLAHGFVFVSVNYRLLPDHVYPAFMNDAAQAVAWVHDNIARSGGDPERINLIGHSAGAHISSLMATNQSFLERQGKTPGIIKSVLSLDIASYNLVRRLKRMGAERKSTRYIKTYGDDERVWIEVSPAWQIEPNEQLPPFLLLYAKDHHEPVVMRTENEAFFGQLKDHGTTTTLYEAVDRTHESLNLRIGFRGDPASREIISFLGKVGMIDVR